MTSLLCADRLGALPSPERVASRSARDRRLDRGLRDVLGGSALRRLDVLALDHGSTGPGESLEGRLPLGSRLRRARPCRRPGRLPHLGTRASLRRTPLQTVLLVPGSSEPSFPSDHATAAFAIAFSVLLVGRRLGLVFVLAAVTIGMSRIFVGVHYPGDVAAGAFIGLLASLVVWRAGRGRWNPIVDAVSRLTDRVVEPLWRVPVGIRTRARRLRAR